MKKREKDITVFGLGKMGLPIAVAYADAGYTVTGVDIDQQVVNQVNEAELWFKEPKLKEKLEKALEEDRIHATIKWKEAAQNADVIIVIVPLKLRKDNTPDFSAIEDVTRKIGKSLTKGQLVIYETTLPPNTIENKIRPKLEKLSGLKAGTDFGLFASPERLYSLHVFEEMNQMKKILGPCKGSNVEHVKQAKTLLSNIYNAGVVVVNNATTAEMTKLAETSFRAVNIAFANELAKLTDEVDVDVKQVIEAANTHRYTNILNPGSGVGGHCMPVYPYFLIKNYPLQTKLIEKGQKINESMPEYIVRLAEKGVKKVGKQLKNVSVLVLGLAYRPNVKEDANSPTLKIVKKMKHTTQQIAVYDPLFSKEEIKNICQTEYWDPKEKRKNFPYDVVIISTGYKRFKRLVSTFPSTIVLIDGRNIIDDTDRFSVYTGVGRKKDP